MRHLDFTPTPLTKCFPSQRNTSEDRLLIKRDDLFNQAGGGSKARMLQYILGSTDALQSEVIVTAGGPLSNFNRACALQCMALGKKVHLISYTDNEREFADSANYFICQLAGAKITICKKTEVRETVVEVMDSYKKKGIKAKNIYGGGRSIEGIYAYYDAIRELDNQLEPSIKSRLRKIYVACGTGTTTSGLSVGLQKYFPGVELHAISVARKRDEEMPLIYENIDLMNQYFSTKDYNGSNITFHDEFILGQYGAVTTDLLATIQDFVHSTGILLDPVYSGKAYYGMRKLEENRYSDSILFWHTGAIYTLLSDKYLFNI